MIAVEKTDEKWVAWKVVEMAEMRVDDLVASMVEMRAVI